MIRKQDLGQPDFIAEGGVGKVYRLPGFSIKGCPPLAYKEVHPVQGAFTAQVRQEALDAMTKSVAFRSSLSQPDRDDLDLYTTWPIDVVEDNGVPCGIVMPLIPQDFFTRTTPAQGSSANVVLELSWLCAKETQAMRAGIDRTGFRDTTIRIALLAQLVYAVGRLHGHGVVYGDLSLRNAALAVNPPRVKLLDCDAAAVLNDQGRKQMHSPFFIPPEIKTGAQKLQDDRTDVFKLGLCIIRGLQQGGGVSQADDPTALAGTLDQRAIDLIGRAVGADRARRPTAKELFDALEANLLAKVTPPVLTSAAVSRPVVVRGQDVEVVWHSSGGKQVRITGPNGLEVTMPDPGITPAKHVVTPSASGEIAVEVSNSHGSVRVVAGDVQLYDLPAFRVDLVDLPRPSTPDVPAVEVPAVLRNLPAVPVVSTTTHPVPVVALPALAPVSEALTRMRPPPGAASDLLRSHPDLGRIATRTSESVHELFEDARARLRKRVTRDVDSVLNRGAAKP